MKIPFYSIIVGLAAIAGMVGIVWFSTSIERFPSCLTFHSDAVNLSGAKFEVSLSEYFRGRNFRTDFYEKGNVRWESAETRVQWRAGAKNWLNICARDENAVEWLSIAKDVQDISLRNRWVAQAHLSLNPELTSCTVGNDVSLSYPVKFEDVQIVINSIMTSCSGLSGPSREKDIQDSGVRS